jgi:hypothetical protein
MKKSFSCVNGVLLTLMVLGCGIVEEQPIGDGPGGTGGSSSSGTSGASTAGSPATEGGSGGSVVTHGTCAEGCDPGFGCYNSTLNPIGVCAPLCDGDRGYRREGVSCGNSVRGGVGVCVFSQGYDPHIMEVDGLPVSNIILRGLCSNRCDPLAQDCPGGYTCDVTATYSVEPEETLYACMPDTEPRQIGDACDATGDGECGPGLTCSPTGDGGERWAICAAFCDLGDPTSCKASQHCVTTAITEQVGDAIGVCAD